MTHRQATDNNRVTSFLHQLHMAATVSVRIQGAGLAATRLRISPPPAN